jgi:hypothetical protein
MPFDISALAMGHLGNGEWSTIRNLKDGTGEVEYKHARI